MLRDSKSTVEDEKNKRVIAQPQNLISMDRICPSSLIGHYVRGSFCLEKLSNPCDKQRCVTSAREEKAKLFQWSVCCLNGFDNVKRPILFVAYANERLLGSTFRRSANLHNFLPFRLYLKMATRYSGEALRAISACSQKARLNVNLWGMLCKLGISRTKPTRRGCRAGLRKQQLPRRPILLASSTPNGPPSCTLRSERDFMWGI